MNGIRKHRASRSKSPSPAGFRSKSPFRIVKRTVVPPSSPWARSSPEKQDHEDFGSDRFKMHESEINVFQQLCLGKYDEISAIEILLESPTSPTKPTISFSENASVPESASIEKKSTFSTASNSTGHGSSARHKEGLSKTGVNVSASRSIGSSSSRELSKKKAGAIEAKRTFLNRFFKKPSPKSNCEAAFPVVEVPIAPNENSRPFDNTRSKSHVQSSVQKHHKATGGFDDTFRASTTGEWTTPMPTCNERRASTNIDSEPPALSERNHSFSNMSELSGSLATSYRNAPPLQRHQSLGLESITDIRMCLKEMETHLARASNKGQRVSRHKLVKALFTVAESLDDDEEKTQIIAELEDEMEAERRRTVSSWDNDNRVATIDEGSEGTEASNEDDFTYESGTFDKEEHDTVETSDSPFNIMSFFGVSAENQEALDDLLWNDFVSSRKEKELKESKHRKWSSRPSAQMKSSMFGSATSQDGSKPERTRSWWRNHPSQKSPYHANAEDEDEDESSSELDEFPSYLPTSITVQKRAKKPFLERHVSPTSFAQHTSGRYKVSQPQLIETESRVGYEMDRSPRQKAFV